LLKVFITEANPSTKEKNMYLLLLALPLMGSLFAGFLGRYLGYRGAAFFLLVVLAFFDSFVD